MEKNANLVLLNLASVVKNVVEIMLVEAAGFLAA
jgi:hypothetical protein